MCKCLYCYKSLAQGEVDFHPACAKAFWGNPVAPAFPYTIDQLSDMAVQIIRSQTSLTGVQPKLSLHLSSEKKLTVVGLWGGYICKPQSKEYAELPQVEDLTMHLAQLAGIDVVPHSLMRMQDGSLCYITKRVDRLPDGQKIPMEDMCQLTERQTEYKYSGSYEKVAKTILQHSAMPKLDVVNFFEVVLFSWLVGNNDMHLKNFSLYAPAGKYRLCPAYDLLNVTIVFPKDTDELALTLNARKKRLTAKDFLAAAQTMGIGQTTVNKLFTKYVALLPAFEQCIQASFLSDELKEKFVDLIKNRLATL